MGLFSNLVKGLIEEELANMANGAVENTVPENSPEQPQEDASNSNDNKNTTDSTQAAQTATDSVKKTPAENPDAFNVELRKMIKKEVRDYAADALNKEVSAGTANGVNVDDVYARLLGFQPQQKGGK